MAGESKPQSRLRRPPGKTPAERSAEFDAKQAKLKAEAAERRKAAAEKAKAEKAKKS